LLSSPRAHSGGAQAAVEWETVCGLEVHVQLGTRTKAFCGCTSAYGAVPNSHVCPVCMGHPGTLPVLNADVVRKSVLMAHALGCTVAKQSKFDRKQYFYPDLPKGYQVSQFDVPIACVPPRRRSRKVAAGERPMRTSAFIGTFGPAQAYPAERRSHPTSAKVSSRGVRFMRFRNPHYLTVPSPSPSSQRAWQDHRGDAGRVRRWHQGRRCVRGPSPSSPRAYTRGAPVDLAPSFPAAPRSPPPSCAGAAAPCVSPPPAG
jgi:hypothetical protein